MHSGAQAHGLPSGAFPGSFTKFEVQQLEHKLEPVWDVGIAGDRFTCCTIMAAVKSNFFTWQYVSVERKFKKNCWQ